MKSGHEFKLTDSQKESVMELLKYFDEDPQVFSYEGKIFLGDKIEVIKRYIALNPSKKFFIWLQDNIPMLYENS